MLRKEKGHTIGGATIKTLLSHSTCGYSVDRSWIPTKTHPELMLRCCSKEQVPTRKVHKTQQISSAADASAVLRCIPVPVHIKVMLELLPARANANHHRGIAIFRTNAGKYQSRFWYTNNRSMNSMLITSSQHILITVNQSKNSMLMNWNERRALRNITQFSMAFCSCSTCVLASHFGPTYALECRSNVARIRESTTDHNDSFTIEHSKCLRYKILCNVMRCMKNSIEKSHFEGNKSVPENIIHKVPLIFNQ